MSDKYNYFIDSLLSAFMRFLELPLFAIFLVTICFAIFVYFGLKIIFRSKMNKKFHVRFVLLFVVLCLLFMIDKKINLFKSEVNQLTEKVNNLNFSNSSIVLKNNISVNEKALKLIYPKASIFRKPLNEAMTLISFKKEDPLARVYITIIDLTHPAIKIKMNENISTKTLTSKFGEKYDCEIAINGEAGESASMDAILGEWTGNYIVNGKVILQKDGELRPFLSFDKNNKPTYFKANIVDTVNSPEKYNTIWGRFDILVENEIMFDERNRPYTRTVMGINKEKTMLYLMVVDGKRPDYSLGLTYAESAKVIQSLGAYNAMACDQGGSTCMYVKSLNGIVNRPADSDGLERPIYTHFGVSLF